jgi:hypothetical protein
MGLYNKLRDFLDKEDYESFFLVVDNFFSYSYRLGIFQKQFDYDYEEYVYLKNCFVSGDINRNGRKWLRDNLYRFLFRLDVCGYLGCIDGEEMAQERILYGGFIQITSYFKPVLKFKKSACCTAKPLSSNTLTKSGSISKQCTCASGQLLTTTCATSP